MRGIGSLAGGDGLRVSQCACVYVLINEHSNVHALKMQCLIILEKASNAVLQYCNYQLLLLHSIERKRLSFGCVVSFELLQRPLKLY